MSFATCSFAFFRRYDRDRFFFFFPFLTYDELAIKMLMRFRQQRSLAGVTLTRLAVKPSGAMPPEGAAANS